MNQNIQVCLACGLNMIAYTPDKCPFCGALPEKFLSAEECSQQYHVKISAITDKVLQMKSIPELGLDHSAYIVKTPMRTYWIDCPASFDRSIPCTDAILFTHHHFFGACQQYRDYYTAQLFANKADTAFITAKNIYFDNAFFRDFSLDGIEAVHIGGHTPGFTMYIFDDIAFPCDYVYEQGGKLKLNPFGPKEETEQGYLRLVEIIKEREISFVCGVDYVMSKEEWFSKLPQVPAIIPV